MIEFIIVTIICWWINLRDRLFPPKTKNNYLVLLTTLSLNDEQEQTHDITAIWKRQHQQEIYSFNELLDIVAIPRGIIITINVAKYSQKHGKFIEYVFAPDNAKYKKGEKTREMIGGDFLPMSEIGF